MREVVSGVCGFYKRKKNELDLSNARKKLMTLCLLYCRYKLKSNATQGQMCSVHHTGHSSKATNMDRTRSNFFILIKQAF